MSGLAELLLALVLLQRVRIVLRKTADLPTRSAVSPLFFFHLFIRVKLALLLLCPHVQVCTYCQRIVPATVGSLQTRDNSSIVRAERWPEPLARSYDQAPPEHSQRDPTATFQLKSQLCMCDLPCSRITRILSFWELSVRGQMPCSHGWNASVELADAQVIGCVSVQYCINEVTCCNSIVYSSQ